MCVFVCVCSLVFNFIVMGLQVREADISRLSFAVEIAEEFYGRFAISLLQLVFSFQSSTLTFLLFFSSLFSPCLMVFCRVKVTLHFHEYEPAK